MTTTVTFTATTPDDGKICPKCINALNTAGVAAEVLDLLETASNGEERQRLIRSASDLLLGLLITKWDCTCK